MSALKQFLEVVRDCRQSQRAFYRLNPSTDREAKAHALIRAKQAEKLLDDWLNAHQDESKLIPAQADDRIMRPYGEIQRAHDLIEKMLVQTGKANVPEIKAVLGTLCWILGHPAGSKVTQTLIDQLQRIDEAHQRGDHQALNGILQELRDGKQPEPAAGGISAVRIDRAKLQATSDEELMKQLKQADPNMPDDFARMLVSKVRQMDKEEDQ